MTGQQPTLVEYDFRRPMTLAREQARVLEVALGTFSRQWANQLLAHIRVPTHVTFDSVGMCSYEDYITALPQRTTLAVCSVGPTRRPAILEFPLAASLVWVDHMLGGHGAVGSVPERDLTDIEQQLVGQHVSKLLADLEYSFYGIVAVDAEFRRIQHAPQVLQVTAASTAVLVANFTITAGEQTVAASLMLPADVLTAAMRDKEAADTRSRSEIEAERAHREQLDLAVQHAPVELAVRLGPVPVQPRTIGDLTVGTLIPLNHPSSQPMDVVVGDRVLAQAVAGTSGSRLAGLVVNVKENS